MKCQTYRIRMSTPLVSPTASPQFITVRVPTFFPYKIQINATKKHAVKSIATRFHFSARPQTPTGKHHFVRRSTRPRTTTDTTRAISSRSHKQLLISGSPSRSLLIPSMSFLGPFSFSFSLPRRTRNSDPGSLIPSEPPNPSLY